jgi:hypothetical protein
MLSSYNIKENCSRANPKIGAITFQRTHWAGIYTHVNKTANKKDKFNDEKTLEPTIFFGL